MSREGADVLNARKILADVWPSEVQGNSVALLKALHIDRKSTRLNSSH